MERVHNDLTNGALNEHQELERNNDDMDEGFENFPNYENINDAIIEEVKSEKFSEVNFDQRDASHNNLHTRNHNILATQTMMNQENVEDKPTLSNSKTVTEQVKTIKNLIGLKIFKDMLDITEYEVTFHFLTFLKMFFYTFMYFTTGPESSFIILLFENYNFTRNMVILGTSIPMILMLQTMQS